MHSIRVQRVRFHQHPIATRFPFRYGIAAMTRMPHLFVRAEVEVAGRAVEGVAADSLPPKWFEKNPATVFETDDLPRMERSIGHAAHAAVSIGHRPDFFAFWQDLYAAQMAWAREQGMGGLLANFGTSLIERAMLDAIARATGLTLHALLRSDFLGLDLAAIRKGLDVGAVERLLPAAPLSSIAVRHTVGLGDPLTAADSTERPADALPYTLEENLAAYSLSLLKIKLGGKPDFDLDRLRCIADLVASTGGAIRFTLDGNEQYHDIDAFRAAWDAFHADPQVHGFLQSGLIFVEQPLHRDYALVDAVGTALQQWRNAPPMIIDEADADLTSLPRALELGYSGTSHKNCKGVIKGLANAALLKQRAAQGRPALLSGEDLTNLGPVALLQDLAVLAALGIEHAERNGHHYFRGLSVFPDAVGAATLADHPDLYRRMDDGCIALAPVNGRLSLSTINAAPFGCARHPDWSQLASVTLPSA